MHYNLQIVALLELHFSFAVLEEEHQNNARFNWSITTSDYELNSLKSSTLIRQKVQNDTWLNPSLDIDCMDLGLLFVFSPVSVRAMVLVSLGTGRSVREM